MIVAVCVCKSLCVCVSVCVCVCVFVGVFVCSERPLSGVIPRETCARPDVFLVDNLVTYVCMYICMHV
jgi:hypothetical protein